MSADCTMICNIQNGENEKFYDVGDDYNDKKL